MPDRIGAYRVVGLIGEGGMGAVYRGERVRGDFDHVVAIKVVRPSAFSDALAERFRNERQTLANLVHPGIARLLDGGETEAGAPFFVMEHVDGRPLSTWMREGIRPLAERVRLFLEVLDAVGHAHQQLVIHRDITPDNILVTRDGHAKLIDFGIAKPLEVASISQSHADSLAGLSLTPGFAAPERLTGGSATTLSDIFSLGIVLDRLIADDADADLRAVIARASAVDPADRYGSAGAFTPIFAPGSMGIPWRRGARPAAMSQGSSCGAIAPPSARARRRCFCW